MNFLVQIIVFAGIASGLLFLLKIDILNALRKVLQKARKPPTMKEITNSSGTAGRNFITRRFAEMRMMLISTGREKAYSRYCRFSLLFAIIGALFALLIGNMFLLPVMFLTGLFVPFLLAYVSSAGFRKIQSSEIETALSVVTSSYMRTDNLLESVAENLDYLHEPAKSAFRTFLAGNEFITSNVEKSLLELKGQINNDIWKEWCEAMVLCQHDSTKRDMLEPIITKLRNMDSVQIELDAMLYRPVKDFFTLLILLLINFPIIYFSNREWFDILLFTIPGKLAVAICFTALLAALFAAMRAVRPLEYKR